MPPFFLIGYALDQTVFWTLFKCVQATSILASSICSVQSMKRKSTTLKRRPLDRYPTSTTALQCVLSPPLQPSSPSPNFAQVVFDICGSTYRYVQCHCKLFPASTTLSQVLPSRRLRMISILACLQHLTSMLASQCFFSHLTGRILLPVLSQPRPIVTSPPHDRGSLSLILKIPFNCRSSWPWNVCASPIRHIVDIVCPI